MTLELGLRVKEHKEVYEGEVIELTPEETENPHGGFSKTISSVVVGLRTAKGTKQLRLDPSIYDGIQKEKIALGVCYFYVFFTCPLIFAHFLLNNCQFCQFFAQFKENSIQKKT